MSEKVLNVEFICPICGIHHFIYEIPVSKLDRVRNRYATGEHIQDIFPDMIPVDRERFISNYCPDCQAEIFGTEEDEDYD